MFQSGLSCLRQALVFLIDYDYPLFQVSKLLFYKSLFFKLYHTKNMHQYLCFTSTNIS